MSGSIDDNQFDATSSNPPPDTPPSDSQASDSQASDSQTSDAQTSESSDGEPSADADDEAWAEAEHIFSMNDGTDDDGIHDDGTYRIASPVGRQDVAAVPVDDGVNQTHPPASLNGPVDSTNKIPVDLVETAFLASTASLLWLISYYLSVVPWMRIFFPAPIALVYLRWGNRSAWMAAIVSCLLLSVLMGPYLSILFLIPYGLLGVQLGALWRRGAPWSVSIAVGTLLSTLSFFFRVGLLSAFIGEDLWVYLTGRITDLLEWVFNLLVNWGFVGVGSLGQPSLALVQIATVVMVIASDIVYLFTVHLTVWLMFERLKTPIPTPPQWVQVLLEEE
jgi:hypothetical protein